MPEIRGCVWLAFAILAGLFLVFTQGAGAQAPSIKQLVEATSPKAPPPADEKADDTRKRLEQWQQEARDALAKLDSGGTSTALPPGISATELEDRRRDLEQLVITTTASLKNIATSADARKQLENARAEESAWTGFKESPPYSILTLDGLLNERDALKAKLTSFQSSFTNIQNILSSVLAETKETEEQVGTFIAAVQNAPADQADAAKWRLESARTSSRLLGARASYMRDSSMTLQNRIDATQSELSLIERKIRTVSANVRFADEDLATVEKVGTERKKSIDKEITEVSKRLKTAMEARNKAQSAVDALASTTGTAPEALELAKFKLDVSDQKIEALQSVTESLEALVQLENANFKAYQFRKAIVTASEPAKKAKSIEELAALYERVRAWENVTNNEVSTRGADLSKLESRAASITSENPRFPWVNEQRAAKVEKLTTCQRLLQVVSAERKLLKRWLNDYQTKPEDITVGQRISGYASQTRERIRKIWSFEVMTFEDKVVVDGQTFTGRIPLTLGMLLRAILFFVIGYWIASRIANRIQNGIVARGHIAEANARTLRNWAMIVISVFLVLGTLSFLKIPLTVFAFFGGALAIGVGFGTQTLIKNFFSGIIVLAERAIRVGDVVDVGGLAGTVTEINTRSSVIRGGDGKETLVPNSFFLENRVTNLTLSNRRVRRTLSVSVSYTSQPQLVITTLKECVDRHGLVLKEPAPIVTLDEFGEKGLNFMIYFWTELNDRTNGDVVASDIRLMVEKRFGELDIQFASAESRPLLHIDQAPGIDSLGHVHS